MSRILFNLSVTAERDILTARQRAREVGALLGYDPQEQIRIAVAVSELARNAVRHAGGGEIDFMIGSAAEAPRLLIRVQDRGPGIADLDLALLDGAQMGGEPRLGLLTAQRMMDSFDIDSRPGVGVRITIGKDLPARAPALTAARIDAVSDELASKRANDPHEEVRQQNRDLLRSLEELRLRQEDLSRLNAELEDTNRGVMALYAELDERATQLRLADETKTRFLASVSHEFRTPVNAILALAQILQHRLDGPLSAEQEKQVGYIRQAAEQLSTLIDDLLDLRKVESGEIHLRIESFVVEDLFAALRGMFKPLNARQDVELIFEEQAAAAALHTDQGKLSQILRNLISNALKFTERGSVRVSAQETDGGERIVFVVADTGVGIASEHHRRIFDEFTQVENPLQRGAKGTGLGLPLSQRLAALLGGHIAVRSTPGEGSVFSLTLPKFIETEAAAGVRAERGHALRILIIDDNEIERYALRQLLQRDHYQVIEAKGGYDGLRSARQHAPDCIFLDLAMPDIHGFEVLKLLRATDATRRIPIVIFTSHLPTQERADLPAGDAVLMKHELSRETVMNVMSRILNTEHV